MFYGVYALMGLGIIWLQSVLLPMWLGGGGGFFDFFVPLVVYLAIYRSAGQGLGLILISGLLLDAITGGAFGLYTLSYLWLFLGLRLAINYLDKNSLMLQFAAVMAGVLLENGFFLLAGVPPDTLGNSAIVGGHLLRQMAWAAVVGPLVVRMTKRAMDHWEASFRRAF